MSDIRRVLDWLAGGALSGEQSQDVLAELCERMVACGIPLWRVAVFVTTLHPDVMGRRFLWQAESGVTTSDALHDLTETDDFKRSPFSTVYETHIPLRRRLADTDCPIDFGGAARFARPGRNRLCGVPAFVHRRFNSRRDLRDATARRV